MAWNGTGWGFELVGRLSFLAHLRKADQKCRFVESPMLATDTSIGSDQG